MCNVIRMRRETYEILVGVALCINCIFSYVIFLLWNTRFYFWIAIGSLVSGLISIIGLKKARTLLRNLYIPIALGINYVCGFTLNFFGQLQDPYFYVFLIVVSLLAGATAISYNEALISLCVALVIGLVISVVIIASAPIVLGEGHQAVNIAVTVALMTLARKMLVGVSCCIFGVLMGCFFSSIQE